MVSDSGDVGETPPPPHLGGVGVLALPPVARLGLTVKRLTNTSRSP